MVHTRHARTARPRRRLPVLALFVVVVVTLGVVLVHQSSARTGAPTAAATTSPAPPTASPSPSPSTAPAGAAQAAHAARGGTTGAAGRPAPHGDEGKSSDNEGKAGDEGESDAGYVSIFDDHATTVTHLNPALLAALRQAATEAQKVGVSFVVDSGWRSAADQEKLLQAAITQYGSKKEAEKWVATPQTSEHVRGDAADLGPVAARTWLSKHGAAYGLCQIYVNESWHYELRPAAVHAGCPAMYADPSHDPRLQG